jgi:hypothetical protein
MSNMHFSNNHDDIGIIAEGDRLRLRHLAQKWIEIASNDIVQERKSLWKSLRDLKPVRPMILFETFSVSGYISDHELKCSQVLLRNVEKAMVTNIRQYEELGDDIVLEKYFRIPWKVSKSDYGVEIIERHAKDSLGYLSNFPISCPDDLNKLTSRTFTVDRHASLQLKTILEDIFGDILPVKMGNYDNFFSDLGFTPFTGNNFVGITMDVFKLIGNENMMLWPYDQPDELHHLMRYLTDDRLRFYRWLEAEGLLDANTDNQFAGPSSYGYISDLPAVETQKHYALSDVWGWAESQETQQISPQMYEDFFLPYIAEVGNLFGHTYYGCCETVDDRFDRIAKAMPNLRTVSVSGWNNFEKMGEFLGNRFVYSRKPTPAFISGSYLNWDLAEKDLAQTYKAAKNGCLELIVRDVYDVDYDFSRLAKWVELAKKTLQM